MNSLINKRAVKSFAMKVASERHHRFTRVREEFYSKTEAVLRRFINEHVHRLPSSGRTIR